MRRGEITTDSRIFHRATSSWISITKHPEYRRLQAELGWYYDPPAPQELVGLPDFPKKRRFLRGLAERGAALAASGWTSLKKGYRKQSVSSRKPPRASRPGSPKSATPKPAAPQAEPSQPAQQNGPQIDPTRKGWTFYP